MATSGYKKITIDDMFDVPESNDTNGQVKESDIKQIGIDLLSEFPNHPFKVVNDEDMQELSRSISEQGVLVPLTVMPKEEGGYYIISGHRRRMACSIIGLRTLPCVVKNITMDEAISIMVDSNLQREKVLPSEKARAYKMKLEAIKRQGSRSDLTSRQVVGKLESADIIGEKNGESGRQVQRYIRLNELSDAYLQEVDDEVMPLGVGVELSYIPKSVQEEIRKYQKMNNATISLKEAQTLKKYCQTGMFAQGVLENFFVKAKPQKDPIASWKITGSKIKQYFPNGTSGAEMEEIILSLLEDYRRKTYMEQLSENNKIESE